MFTVATVKRAPACARGLLSVQTPQHQSSRPRLSSQGFKAEKQGDRQQPGKFGGVTHLPQPFSQALEERRLGTLVNTSLLPDRQAEVSFPKP